jgi:hypothetical protein
VKPLQAEATRFLSDQTHNFDLYIARARDYVTKLDASATAWLRQKPYHVGAGHVPFWQLIFPALNLIEAMALPQEARVLEIGWITEIMLLLGYSVDALEPATDLQKIAQERIAALEAHYGVDLSWDMSESRCPANRSATIAVLGCSPSTRV